MIVFEAMMGDEATKVDPEGSAWPWDTFVLFARDGTGKIVGRITTMNLPVVEGTWTAEEYRGSTLAYRLLKQMEETMSKPPISKPSSLAMAADATPEIADYLRRVGYEQVPVKLFVKGLGAKKEAA